MIPMSVIMLIMELLYPITKLPTLLLINHILMYVYGMLEV